MILHTVVVAALASMLATCTPISNKRVVHEKRTVASPFRSDRVDSDAIIPVRIALKQSNLEHGYSAVMDVSDPDSPNYGKHWTLEQVREFFAPPKSSREAVHAWLREFGIHHSMISDSDDGAWIGINIPVSQAEDLLSAQYYEHKASDATIRLGCDEYSLPSYISDLVDYIKPGISLSPPIKKRDLAPRSPSPPNGLTGRPIKAPFRGVPPSAPGDTSLPADLRHCGTNITTACYRALYDIPVNNANNSANNLGIVEVYGSYAQADLNEYYAKFNPEIKAGTHPVIESFDGGVAPQPQKDASLEADIDFEIAIPLIYPQSTAIYIQGDGFTSDDVSFNEDYPKQSEYSNFLIGILDALDSSFCNAASKKNGYQCGGVPLPRVLSVSYGSDETFLTQATVVRSCNEIMKLSLQGTTIIFSSGDYGVTTQPYEGYNGCVNAKSYNPNKNGTVFNPTFPSGCPYVLSVGATQLVQGQNVYDPESAMYIPELTEGGVPVSSSGGFSNVFKRPTWQNEAVKNYLDNYAPNYPSYVYNGHDIFSGKTNIGANGGLYNRAGRGYPDVSANGVNFTTVVEGEIANFAGTSLSTPVWGAIITLINEARTAKNQPPVGFVQPVLYKNPQAFHDITAGINPGCGTKGFPAVKGWDPITGLGTPNFPELLKVFTGGA